jgi:SAM-dependent methyltransferase
VVEPSDRSTNRPFNNSSLPTGEGIVIDIGTGDGLFVYQCALDNPNKFFIGIDANPRPMEKLSEKIHRKPKRGGAINVLFLQAAVESLPPELDGIADEVHVHFPWGSLLKAVATGAEEVLQNLRRICSHGGLLEIMIGLDPEKDKFEMERLGVKRLSPDYLESVLLPLYEAAGFEVLEAGPLKKTEWPAIASSWAKRLQQNSARELVIIIARAC